MKLWIYAGLGFGSLWLQVGVAPYLSVFGIKPDLMLLMLLVVALRWIEPWLFVYAALAGLALDVFSHGVLGVYGLSFFLVSFLARYVGFAIYENNVLFTMAAVAGLTLAEGVIAITIFELLDPTVPWWHWLLTVVLPLSLYHGLIAPFLMMGLIRLERLTKLGETGGVRP